MSQAIAQQPQVRFRDNPLMVAQARRRLRPRQAVPTFVVAAVLAICCLLFAALATDSESWTLARNFLFFILVAVLYGGGAMRVGATVAEDRASGLMDFHRATPTTPWTDALGYVFGCAAREYAVAAILLPFLMLTSLIAGDSAFGLVMGLGLLLLNGLLFHCFAMFASLTTRRRFNTRMSPVGLVLMVFFVAPLATGSFAALAHMTPLPAFASLGLLDNSLIPTHLDFFGISLSHFVYTLMLQSTLVAFLFWASARKLGREGTHAFSRVGAFAFFAAIVTLFLGPLVGTLTQPGYSGFGVALFLVLTLILALVLALGLVPSYLGHIRCSRRAHRQGQQPSWLQDGASAWPVIPVLVGLQALAFGVLAMAASSRTPLPTGALEADVVLLALGGSGIFLAFAVGALEYARLGLQRASRGAVFLIGFLTLVLPWILGGLVSVATDGSDMTGFLFCLSPLFAAGGSALLMGLQWGISSDPGSLQIQVIVAVALTAVYAAFFHWRAAQVRKAIREDIRSSQGGPRPTGA